MLSKAKVRPTIQRQTWMQKFIFVTSTCAASVAVGVANGSWDVGKMSGKAVR